MIQEFMRFLIILITLASFFFSNSIAENHFKGKKIQELLDEGYSIIFTSMEDKNFYIMLKKKPNFEINEGKIRETTSTELLICKFNFEETVCKKP